MKTPKEIKYKDYTINILANGKLIVEGKTIIASKTKAELIAKTFVAGAQWATEKPHKFTYLLVEHEKQRIDKLKI